MPMRTETDKLVKDLKTCACDAEELIKSTAGELNDKTKEARLRLKATLSSAKESCEALEEKALNGVKAADRTIRTYPYESLGIALGLGLLIGLLIGRRS
jgi:ElaB/YqjD/DUF883 family membrane-anchored ribosome-binding protein